MGSPFEYDLGIGTQTYVFYFYTLFGKPSWCGSRIEVGIWRLLLGKMTVVISDSYSKPGENCKIPVAVLPFVIMIRAMEVGAAVVLAHNQHCA